MLLSLLWPFNKKETVLWEQPVQWSPTIESIQAEIEQLKEGVEENKVKIGIMQRYQRVYDYSWHKEMVDLEFTNYRWNRNINKLENQQKLIMDTDGFAHD